MRLRPRDPADALAGLGTAVFLLTWLTVLVLWAARGELPETAVQLVRYVTVTQCVCFAAYCCKCAYERKKTDPCG